MLTIGTPIDASFFQQIPQAAPDAIFHLTAQYQADTDPRKVNVGVGAYRDDNLKPYILPVVKKVNNRNICVDVCTFSPHTRGDIAFFGGYCLSISYLL